MPPAISTGDGDGGKTRDGAGHALSKTDPLITCLNEIDRLSVAFGSLKLQAVSLKESLEMIQTYLIEAGGVISGALKESGKAEEALKYIEKQEELLLPETVPAVFVQPGTGLLDIAAHQARVAARGAEIALWCYIESSSEGGSQSGAQQWAPFFNRLSDYCFLMRQT